MHSRTVNHVDVRWWMLSAGLTVLMVLTPMSVHAGPCSAEIDLFQATIDARIDTTAGIGPMGRESTAATEHHQPTPGSIVQAEESLGQGSNYGPVIAALEQARQADQAGDAASCQRALGAARTSLDR